jgi:hypothetical protein
MSAHEPGRHWLRIIGATIVAVGAMAAVASAQTMSGTAVPHAAIATASTPPAPILGGFTSQGWPAVIDFAKNGKRIRLIAVGLDMKCTSGAQFATEDGFTSLAIPRNGRIHATGTIRPSTGLTGGSDSLTGRFNRNRTEFVGSWELHLSFQSSTGQTDECDSGHVALAARL